MLIALYQEQMNFDNMGFISFGDLVIKYGLDFKTGWLISAQKSLREQGLVEGPSNGHTDSMALAKISGRGMREVEEQYGSKDGVGIILQPVLPSVADDMPEQNSPPAVNSSAWTGLSQGYVLTENNRAALVRNLDTAEGALGQLKLSQEAQSQVRAYVVAAKALAEAPEPQADLIWELVNRASSIAGVASLFVSIIALFVH